MAPPDRRGSSPEPRDRVWSEAERERYRQQPTLTNGGSTFRLGYGKALLEMTGAGLTLAVLIIAGFIGMGVVSYNGFMLVAQELQKVQHANAEVATKQREQDVETVKMLSAQHQAMVDGLNESNCLNALPSAEKRIALTQARSACSYLYGRQ